MLNLIVKAFVFALIIIAFLSSNVSDIADNKKLLEPIKNVISKQDLEIQQVTIERVVDGDTVVVKFSDGSTGKVRLLLVDTPESVHPTKGAQPFGKEASEYAKSILTQGKQVMLELGNPDKDKYGRWLGYIWVDEKNFNKMLIEEGYARVGYVNPPNTKYLDEFYEAENQAKKQKLRIWSIPGYVTDRGFSENSSSQN